MAESNQGKGNRGGGGGGRGGGRNSSRGGGGGGRGQGRGGGRDNSSFDQQQQQPRGGRGGGPSNNNNKMSKVERKAGRRQKQLETMKRKAEDEDAYFRFCQKEAQKKPRQQQDSTNTPKNKERETELFGKQVVKGINFDKYNSIQVEVKVPDNNNTTTTTAAVMMEDFTQLQHVTSQLQDNIGRMKYTHPTPIQKHAIPMAMNGHDLMCCAQTGSGKTCAFLLPVVAGLLRAGNKKEKKGGSSNNNSTAQQLLEPAKPKCIVLAPTRELACQIELEAEKLTYGISSVRPVVVYGGASPKSQLKELAYASSSSDSGSGTHNSMIVVATPGRLMDFVDRNLISLCDVQYLILDEGDRMLDMGFEPAIRKLVQKSGMTSKDKRQTLMFSATFPPAIQKLASEFLRPSYVWIAIGRVGSTTDSITQVLVKATSDKRRKLALVVEALQNGPNGRTLIFVQKKRSATWLKKQLCKGGPDAGAGPKHGGGGDRQQQQRQQQPPHPPLNQGQAELKFTPIPAEEIHGDRSQSQRESALEKFRSGKCNVLVATDVAARGLDIPGVEHVINMDLPNAADDFDSYVHRIGRTGRAGHEGLATSLFVPGDDPKAGNGRIATLLVAQLIEANQEVPVWLESLVAGGGGGGGAKNGGSKKPQFGGTDVRKSSSRRPPNNKDNNNKSNGEAGKQGDGSRGRGRGRGPGRGRREGGGGRD